METQKRTEKEIKDEITSLLGELLSVHTKNEFIATGWVLSVRGASLSDDDVITSVFKQPGLDPVSGIGLAEMIHRSSKRWMTKRHEH